jgi:hypothetical protein
VTLEVIRDASSVIIPTRRFSQNILQIEPNSHL